MRRKDREVTEMEEIQQIFDECKVCRIGIMDENGPYISGQLFQEILS